MTTADIHGFRHLLLDGAINFRDLGGYRATDGRTIRPRLLFRSDLRRDHGSTRGFVESIGVEPIVLDTLAALVLEPA